MENGAAWTILLLHHTADRKYLHLSPTSFIIFLTVCIYFASINSYYKEMPHLLWWVKNLHWKLQEPSDPSRPWIRCVCASASCERRISVQQQTGFYSCHYHLLDQLYRAFCKTPGPSLETWDWNQKKTSVMRKVQMRSSLLTPGWTYMYLLGICPFPSFCAFSSSCQATQYPKLPFGSVSSTYRISSLLKLSSCSTSATLS